MAVCCCAVLLTAQHNSQYQQLSILPELEQITCLPSEKDREVIYQAQCMEPAITEISLLSDTLTVSSQINNAQLENVAINDVLPLKAARRDAIAN